MRACVHDNVALPPLPLAYVVEDRDAAGCLHDPPVAAGPASELGQPAGQAAGRQFAALRTIVAVDRNRVVAGGGSPNCGEGAGSYLPPLQAGDFSLQVSVACS